MAKVYVFLANGFEDIEALIPIDVLRRGSVEVITVSTTDTDIVESAHGVGIRADVMFDDCDLPMKAYARHCCPSRNRGRRLPPSVPRRL